MQAYMEVRMGAQKLHILCNVPTTFLVRRLLRALHIVKDVFT